ncbi:hypothetical protein C0J52_12331 [Blattella germanica]|nr:hypothetical protein C0J52_12331 [Blattella germanica]
MAFNKSEQSFCALEYVRASSVVTEQRHFPAQFQKIASVHNSIKHWFVKFCDKGCMSITYCPGCLGPSEETESRVREAYQSNTRKSTTHGSVELGFWQPTVWQILHKRLMLIPYTSRFH